MERLVKSLLNARKRCVFVDVVAREVVLPLSGARIPARCFRSEARPALKMGDFVYTPQL